MDEPTNDPKNVEQGVDYSNLNQPEPMGGDRVTARKSSVLKTPPISSSPRSSSPKPYIPILLMGFLALVLIGGVLLFFAWKGWINVGFLNGPKASPVAIPTPSPSESVELSPTPVANINDQVRKSDLVKIQEALKKYFVAKGEYPVSINELAPNYIEKLPVDPLSPQYYYGYKSDGKSFELTCVLEDKTDPAGEKIGNYYIYKITGS